MDKNKSVYKLKNIPPIYYLNLDGQPERRQYMEEQFKYWEIENYTRISAYDGRQDDLSDIIKGRYPDNMTGCTTSHLKALQHWIETSDSPYAVIMEDDYQGINLRDPSNSNGGYEMELHADQKFLHFRNVCNWHNGMKVVDNHKTSILHSILKDLDIM